ncbi:MAG TPA: hypothetical protein VFW73_07820, partial [Lacipirellulaceae bacterium]|nr:hypothetical protein [Lacipirellulaceae bacterium]
DESPLLTIPRKPHGGMNAPIFGPRQEQAYKHLVDWVALIAPPARQLIDEAVSANDEKAHAGSTVKSKAPSPRPLPEGEGSRTLAKPVAKAKRERVKSTLSSGNQSPDNRAAKSKPQPGVQPAVAIEDGTPHTLGPPHRLQYGVQLERWQPRDAFDPEIFNRQQRQPAGKVPAAAGETTNAGDR